MKYLLIIVEYDRFWMILSLDIYVI